MHLEWPERMWIRGERGWTTRPVTPEERAERQYVESFWQEFGKPPRQRDPANYADDVARIS